MIYIDTNVIVSFINDSDSLHGAAKQLLDLIGEERVVSQLVMVELYSVFSRVLGINGAELDALVEYSLVKTNTRLKHVDCERVVSNAINYAGLLRLRALDLMHVIAARVLGARGIASFDNDIARKKQVIRRVLGLHVYSLEDIGGLST